MKKLKYVGVLFVLTGLVLIVVGGAVFYQARAGAASLQAVYKAQNVMMSYDDEGNFIDHGNREGGDAILKLLTQD